MEEKIYELEKDVLWVQGALKSAIYDYNNNNIYSLNNKATQILKNYIECPNKLKEDEIDFLKKIEEKKLISNEYKPIEKSFSAGKHFLNFAWLELTSGCNLRCVHCYEGETHSHTQESLTTEEWKNIIKQLSDMSCRRIVFIGGEPCIYKDLNELLEYAGKLNFRKITLFTNATLLSKKTIDIVKENNVQVRFSLYGSNAEIHDKITKKNGSFDNTMYNIKLLKNMGINVSPSVIIMKENEDDLENIKSLLKSMNINLPKYDVIRKVYGGSQDEHLTTKRDVVLPLYRTKPNFVADKKWLKISGSMNTCWSGKFAISPNGDVFPCEFERNIVYGNAKRETISEIMNSFELKRLWNLDFSKINICKDCEYRLACKDCRPLGMSTNGDILDKNPRCLYDPYTGEWGKI